MLAASATVEADEVGLTMRHGWLSERFGWQRHWRWRDLLPLSDADTLEFELASARRVLPLPWVAFGGEWERQIQEFSGQARTLAINAGVPLKQYPSAVNRRRDRLRKSQGA